ncbi:ubiquitin-protein ligase E3 C [Puccinia graminis f. sp. tritici CRL 75-36-700-3]|uniref:HECT-type E3 ubiquitin transferase n=1 Tax=Puccinia graminis f. sp. tritici (strain CRL 75-36-700-3 / race SCCL) TaxID=418459 RepID=E3KC91_PUCGT|nr:ubiquitin-protein ligase E3 C [Puccinia graminis f. sp. tritici CRL 75-36-700-3]EFP81849.1 ubiquitin-protein ligase E3 C [Puccinia graminis f. sp. tritici CRL 75-36-700-3]
MCPVLWKVLREFDDLTKQKLLRFVTSCARPPLLGFKELWPSFVIPSSRVDCSRLPSASTCVNLLKLPKYQTKAELQEKVLYAINAGAGFRLLSGWKETLPAGHLILLALVEEQSKQLFKKEQKLFP